MRSPDHAISLVWLAYIQYLLLISSRLRRLRQLVRLSPSPKPLPPPPRMMMTMPAAHTGLIKVAGPCPVREGPVGVRK